jgi:ADP-dependent NAD(P)H-hydrate dehydratase / NAD(P)H-hydrate epimerase
MKVLTAAQMREADRRTIEIGIPGIVLMENAGHRVVEFLAERYRPLAGQRIVVLCGKGNNGGDGLVVARQLFTRFHPRSLDVVLLAQPDDLRGDAALNWKMLEACGCPAGFAITPAMNTATLVIDALLGTGISGPARGAMLDAIRLVNHSFPLAQVVAVDIPSGLSSDTGETAGEFVRADATVTFTALKVAQAMPPACDHMGELHVAAIGSPESIYDDQWLAQVEPEQFAHLLAPRPRGGHKGTFGHVLVVGGSRGKTGAPAMSGLAALRAGAGLVTVAAAESAVAAIAAHAAELMTEPLPEGDDGSISLRAFDYGRLPGIAEKKDVIAIGPGIGRHSDIAALVARALADFEQPLVLDADALVDGIHGSPGRLRVLTPHPGEMARLTGKSTAAVQSDRIGVARGFAVERQVVLVLKGQRTLIAFPDGRVWINPTGTPALGTGGSGDILTGLIAGFLAQFPDDPDNAIAAAIYLGGLAGEIGARTLGEKPLLAGDILTYLHAAMEECVRLSHRI